MTTTNTVRVKISIPTSSGNRKGWAKWVQKVDTTKTNGYGFIGDFLNTGKEYDLPVGAVVVMTSPEGSVKNGWTDGYCYRVTPNGLKQVSNPINYFTNFLTFRDLVSSTLDRPYPTTPVTPATEAPKPAGGVKVYNAPQPAPAVEAPKDHLATVDPTIGDNQRVMTVAAVRLLIVSHKITFAELRDLLAVPEPTPEPSLPDPAVSPVTGCEADLGDYDAPEHDPREAAEALDDHPAADDTYSLGDDAERDAMEDQMEADHDAAEPAPEFDNDSIPF